MEHALNRARLSFLGLSVGDAFGQQYFLHGEQRQSWIRTQTLPPATWYVTDDTIMTISIMRSLEQHRGIEQTLFARDLASMYQHHGDRGYGGTAHKILREIHQGIPWQTAASEVFDGMGSMGNGAAMRAAPVGAYFADDLQEVIAHTRAQAEVTHAHKDAQDAALAIALAAALIVTTPHDPKTLITQICEHLPDGTIRALLLKADRLPRSYRLQTAVSALGNGVKLLGSDTVPLVLWCLTRHPGQWDALLWSLFECGGDVDTTCAIAGGLAVLQHNVDVPEHWIQAREDLSPLLSAAP